MSTRYTNVYWQRVCTISIRCRRSRSSTRGTSSAWRGERGEGAAPRPRRGWGWGSWGTLAAGRQPLCYSASPSEKLEDVCADSPGPVGGGGGGVPPWPAVFPAPLSPRGVGGVGVPLCPAPLSPRPQRSKHLVVLQAGDHDLRQNDDACPSHARTAVDQQRGVRALGFTRAVRMASNRLDLFEVCCETWVTQTDTKGLRPVRPTIFRSSPLAEKAPDTEPRVPMSQPSY